jgi:pyruvate kinase
LLGKPKGRREVRIMVTFPTEAASDCAWVRDVIRRGADCARINCAHDSEDEWRKMIRNVRKAEKQTGRACRILMDLAGPRARTAQARLPPAERRVRKAAHIFLTRPGHTGAPPKGEKFRDDMGINFPRNHSACEGDHREDVANLDFICAQAEILGYSFVQELGEMDELFAELAARRRLRRTGRPLGIVAKIETARAVHNLPELIVRGPGRVPFRRDDRATSGSVLKTTDAEIAPHGSS